MKRHSIPTSYPAEDFSSQPMNIPRSRRPGSAVSHDVISMDTFPPSAHKPFTSDNSGSSPGTIVRIDTDTADSDVPMESLLIEVTDTEDEIARVGSPDELYIDIYAARMIVERRKSSDVQVKTLIPYEVHLAQAFKAAREGNTALLSILLYDGRDYERDLISHTEMRIGEAAFEKYKRQFIYMLLEQQHLVIKDALERDEAHLEMRHRDDLEQVCDEIEEVVDACLRQTLIEFERNLIRRQDVWYAGTRFNYERDVKARKECLDDFKHTLVQAAGKHKRKIKGSTKLLAVKSNLEIDLETKIPKLKTANENEALKEGFSKKADTFRNNI